MALSPEEARIRRVAGMLKLDPAIYRLHVEAGEKWCTSHRDWHDRSAFGVRRSKADGLMTICRERENRRARIGMRKARDRRLAASGTVVKHRRRGPRCACGDVLVEATRYEAARVIDVRLCLECGAEDPPCCPRSASARNVGEFQTEATCDQCGAAIGRRYDGSPIYCSLDCQSAGSNSFRRRAAS